MNKSNVFRSSEFFMAEGDILHIIIVDESGIPVTILVTSDGQGEVLPATPVALPATAVLSDGFTANWQLQTNTTGYYINIATDPDMTPHVGAYDHYPVPATGELSEGNVSSLAITGLTSGVTYYYTVSAYNPDGESGESNIIATALAGTVIGLLNDKDGNDYHTVVIGNLEVIVENLKTTTYADDSAIPNLITNPEWAGTAEVRTVKHGYLYNWFVVNDARNIAAAGSHVPTFTEFISLMTSLDAGTAYGVSLIAGGYLKKDGIIYWDSPNTGADNSSGFSALGSGRRNSYDGTFGDYKISCEFASSEVWDISAIANGLTLGCTFASVSGMNYGSADERNKTGVFVRLIKDSTTLINGQTGTYTGNDGRVYNTICIGTKEWMSENLAETQYRNGDLLTKVTDNTLWIELTTEGYCAYDNDETNAFDITPAVPPADGYCWYNNEDPFDPSDPSPDQSMLEYGALYNWPAVNSAHGLAYFERDSVPETGWVVLTNAQWAELVASAGGSVVAGGALKESGNSHWNIPNTGATNSSGFTGLGAGYRTELGVFGGLNFGGFFWTATEQDIGAAIDYILRNSVENTGNVGTLKATGYSVRCVRPIITGTAYVIYENDGSIFRKGVRIGSYVIDKVNPDSILGFSGVEDVDWYNIKTITFVVPQTPITEPDTSIMTEDADYFYTEDGDYLIQE